MHALAKGAAAALACALVSAPALARTGAPTSLCAAQEKDLFSCPIHGKLVSVCGLADGKATYRFGRPGRVELQSRDLHEAEQGFSGGGEDQISFSANGYRYLVYAKTVRTGFGPDGHNDPQSTSGLVVQKAGRTLSSVLCGGEGDQPIVSDAHRFIPPGPYVEH